MRAKDAFTLVKRRRQKRVVWAYRLYDAEGRRVEYSTGLTFPETSKTAARAAVNELYRQGRLVPAREESGASKRPPLFQEVATPLFQPDGPLALRRRAVGRPLSSNYLAAADSAVRVHLLPAFGALRINEITPAAVQDWTTAALCGKGAAAPAMAGKSARNILSTLSAIFAEAQRRGLITENPCRAIELPSKAPRVHRDALRPPEIIRLLEPSLWKNPVARSAFIVALGTGARLGEIRALKGSDVHDGYIEIARSWSVTEGEKCTKARTARIAPLPRMAQDALDELVGLWGEGLLFTLNGKTPISPRYLQDSFQKALESAGISTEERQARGLTFHALRSTYNTFIRSSGLVSEAKLRAIVGHTTEALTDRYTAFSPADLDEARVVAESMFVVKEV